MLQYYEKMLVIACCDAEGQKLPPSVIFKGIRGKKIGWSSTWIYSVHERKVIIHQYRYFFQMT